MVAKSEASMPMSRALAKLAVATDLGTAARPSTSAAACCNTTTLTNANGAYKHPLSTGAGSFRLLKPSSSRHAARTNLLAAMSQAGRDAPGGRSGSPPPPPAAAAAPATAAPITTTSPTTPRLPPLSSASPHAAPSPAPQLPPAAPPVHYAPVPSTPLSHHRSGPPQQRLPLPACGPSAASDIGKELRETAKKHPGLPASLLKQLHHPCGSPVRTASVGSPAVHPAATTTAPATAASVSAKTGANTSAAAAAASGTGTGATLGSSLSCGAPERPSAQMRPLSPRTRARATASLTVGVDGAAAVAGGGTQPVSSLTALSPEALAVLLAPSQSAPPPTPGGLLVMRRSSALVSSSSGGGAPLRPSPPSGGSSAAASGTAVAVPVRPSVVPHITVPYKPGSIRLPPGSRCGTVTGPDAGARQGLVTAASLPGPAPGTAAGGGEPLRPWTSAGAPSALRPATANPLTHSMAPDPATTIVVRMPRGASDMGVAGSKSGAAAASASAGVPPTTAALALLQHQHQQRQWPPQTAASTISLCSTRSICGTVIGGGQGTPDVEGVDSRQLSTEELQALVVALAAARPQAAAMLLSRPGTAAKAESGSRPATGLRRPCTGAGDDGAAVVGVAEGRPATRCSSRCGKGGEEGPLRRPVSRRGSGSANAWHDDKWPNAVAGEVPGSLPEGSTPRSAGSARPGNGAGRGSKSNSGNVPAASSAVSVAEGAAAAIAAVGSRGTAASSGRATAWGTRRRPLQPIPEDMELSDEEAVGKAGSDEALMELLPLEPLDPDTELDAAWEYIINANQRPDTAALQSPFGSINVFSEPVNIPRQARQAGPMVLVVDNISASTPEVVERELTALSLEELKLLRDKLIG